MATDKQVKYIQTLENKAGISSDLEKTSHMTSRDASDYIDELQTKLGIKKKAKKQKFNPQTLGLASKLVNERWIAVKMNPLKYPSDFIYHVEKMYDILIKTEEAVQAA